MKLNHFSLVFSLVIIVVLTSIYFINFELFLSISQEDGLLENIQFIFFILPSFFGIYLCYHFKKANEKLLFYLYLIFILGCFGIAMEEISWGQRFFGWESSETVKLINIQNETSIHNLHFIQQKIYNVFILIGLYGCLSSILYKMMGPIINKRIDYEKWKLLIVDKSLIFFFLPIMLYGYFRVEIGTWAEISLEYGYDKAYKISIIQESVELMMALGFLFIILNSLSQILKKKRER